MGIPGRLVCARGLPGALLWKWEPPVPFVHPSLLGSSIFLYGSEDDARAGANWGGSGVLVGIRSKANPSRTHLYAVTNDHVVTQAGCTVVRLVKRDGEPYVLPDGEWVPHPDGDDLAIRPLGAVADNEYWYVNAGLLLMPRDLGPKAVGPGDDCLMVGRYINQEFEQFDRPVVRFGNLAMLPELVHQRERSFDQESFLVDMRSHAGFSGSPVFVYYEDLGWRDLPELVEPPKTGDAFKDLQAETEALKERVAGRHLSGVMGKHWLLGIEWGHLPVWGDVHDGTGPFARMQVSSGMAGVVPAWKLVELLFQKGVEMARDKAEEQLSEKDEGAAVLDASEPDEFAQFEDLTRKLVQVPKRELDEKRRAEKNDPS
jgi:hypothetical protein